MYFSVCVTRNEVIVVPCHVGYYFDYDVNQATVYRVGIYATITNSMYNTAWLTSTDSWPFTIIICMNFVVFIVNQGVSYSQIQSLEGNIIVNIDYCNINHSFFFCSKRMI